MKSINEKIKEKPWIGWALFLGTMVVVFLLGLLASSLVERRAEARIVQIAKGKIKKLESELVK